MCAVHCKVTVSTSMGHGLACLSGAKGTSRRVMVGMAWRSSRRSMAATR